MPSSQFFTACIALCALPSLPIAAGAQTYPVKPVRIVVPFAAGGTFDQIGRVVAQKLTETWGQQVIVDNRPGGATILAAELVSKAAADGYTLLLSPNGLAANPALHKKLPYDAQKDLQPIVLVASQPMAIGAHPSFAASDVKGLIALAKSKPGALSYGTAGIGSGGHLAGEIFKSAAGLDIAHISYKGGNVAMLEVIANQIPLVVTGLPNLLPQARAGKIRILAITEAKRSPAAPEIPTVQETIPGYEFRNWFGIVAPAGTPAAVSTKINADVNALLRTADVRQRLLDQGFNVIGGSANEFAQTLREDTQKFGLALKQAGITAQ